MMRRLNDNPTPLIIGVCVLLLGLAVWLAVLEDEEWQAFAEAHHCVVVGEMRSSVAPTMTFGSGDIGATFIAKKTGYQCDDGVTYWR